MERAHIGAMLRLACAAASALVLGGCLSTSYTLEREELARLARTPPAERGQRVRVTQDLSFESDPPPPTSSSRVHGHGHGAVDLGIALAVNAPQPAPHHHGGGRAVHARPAEGSRPTVAVRSPEGGGPSGGGSSGGSSGSSSSSGGDSGSGGDSDDSGDGPSAVMAVLLVAASAGIAVALGVTEGSRYDGWVSLSPDHPVHLEGPDGEQAWVPLAGLDPGLAEWAEEARISGEEGAVFRAGRAPLDRVGFVYSLTLGAAETGTVDREGAFGFAARTSVGYFPLQQFGIVAGLGVGLSDTATDDVVEWRPHLELQTYPLAVGRFHAGIYLQGGHAFGTEGSQDVDGWYWGSGLLAQIDLTTRLALDLRGGFSVLTDPGESQVAPEALIGVSIY